MGKLNALQVAKLKAPGMYSDGDGLYLQIARGKSKSWIFRYRFKGHTSKAGKPIAREMGLGSANAFSLAEARQRAQKQRQLLADGKDPIEVRNQLEAEEEAAKKKAVSFRDCAARYIEAKKAGWKSLKHAEQWTATLERWAYPILGDLSVDGLTQDHIMEVLEQPISDEPDAPSLWIARTETANRVRGRIETVLDWAKTKKLRGGENPARWRGHLKHLLPSRSEIAPVEHHKATKSECPVTLLHAAHAGNSSPFGRSFA
jgi:Arm DNA-binding domain